MRKALITTVALAAIVAASGCTAAKVTTGDGPTVKAGATTSAPAPATTEAEPTPEVETPKADFSNVTITSCKATNEFGLITIEAKGKVTNTEATRQDIAIQIEAVDANGERVGELYGMASNVGPKQTVKYDAVAMDEYDTKPVFESCKVIGVAGMDAS